MKIDKIFIIHYEPLIERKIYLESQLIKLGFEFEFVKSNKESDEKLDILKFFDKEKLRQDVHDKIKYVSIKHFETYKKIIEEKLNYCIILEDDAIFTEEFKEKLDSILNELKEIEFDFCFLSSGCNLVSNNILPNKKIYESNTSRTVSGYIVKSNNLPKIIESYPFLGAIDWHLNWIKEDLGLKFFWAEPPIILHGSETAYQSNLR